MSGSWIYWVGRCGPWVGWLSVFCAVMVGAGPAGLPPGSSPVTVRVIDGGTREPVTSFEYFVIVETADGERHGDWEAWLAVDSATGTFQVDAPESCQLGIGIRSPKYVYEYPRTHDRVIRSDDAERVVTIELERGLVVRGLVLDETTDAPIANALVSPQIYTPPGYDIDCERGVKTDEQGRFELRFVSDSIAVEHADYCTVEHDFYEVARDEVQELTIRLDPGLTVTGRVVTPDGRPVVEALVEDGDGKKAETDDDGQFELRGVRLWAESDSGLVLSLDVWKRGYVHHYDTYAEIPEAGLVITLEPLLRITGSVVDGEGQPVPRFRVYAGPGGNPDDWRWADVNVEDLGGSFAIETEF